VEIHSCLLVSNYASCLLYFCAGDLALSDCMCLRTIATCLLLQLVTFFQILIACHPSAIFVDFFDAAAEPEASTSTHAVAETLPEGFFDDPKLDAKVLSLLLFLRAVN